MAFTIGNIVESIARDIDRAYRRLKKEGVSLGMSEIDVTIGLEAELDGEPEASPIKGTRPPQRGIEAPISGALGRLMMDQKTFAQKGIAFKRIATPGPDEGSGKERRNLEIRFSFIPIDDE